MYGCVFTRRVKKNDFFVYTINERLLPKKDLQNHKKTWKTHEKQEQPPLSAPQ